MNVTEKTKTKQVWKPLTWDKAFKKMFGDEEGIKRCTALLSILLDIPYETLENNVELINTEKRIHHQNDKRQAVDILAKVELSVNQKINIELNVKKDITKINRNLGYLSQIFGNQLKNKEDYSNLNRCLQINFNDFDVDPKNTEIIDDYSMRNRRGYEMSDLFKIWQINVEKVSEIWYTKDIKKYKKYEQQIIEIATLIAADTEEKFKKLLEVMQMDKNIKEDIMETAEDFSYDENMNLWYDEDQMNRALLNGAVNNAEKRGLEKGLTKGNKEKAIEIAKNLLKNNIDIEIISNSTGLTEEKINKLK